MFAYTCPHCGAERAAFQIAHSDRYQVNAKLRWLAAVCRLCGEPMIVKLLGQRDSINIAADPRQDGWTFITTWPAPVMIEAPSDTPEPVAGYYCQAKAALRRQHADAAGMLARKTMEATLKLIAPQAEGKTLAARIDNLPAELGITPAMRDWAHAIRVIGNDAAHETDPTTLDDATAAVDFAEVFLEYAFTLPAQVKRSRS